MKTNLIHVPVKQPAKIVGDLILEKIIQILREAREEDEAEDLERHIEAARSIA